MLKKQVDLIDQIGCWLIEWEEHVTLDREVDFEFPKCEVGFSPADFKDTNDDLYFYEQTTTSMFSTYCI